MKLTGVKLKKESKRQLFNNESYRFVITDIKSLDAKVSSIHLVYVADALNLFYTSKDHKIEGNTRIEAEVMRLLDQCRAMFVRARCAAPTCSFILNQYSSMLLFIIIN